MLLIIYNILLPLALLVTFPFYLRRMLKRGGYARSFLQRFGIYPKELADRFAEGGWTWIRAVSVGEIVMALRLIEELKRQFPDFKAVISTTTSTGFALGQQRRDNRSWIEIIYNPIDFSRLRKYWVRFLNQPPLFLIRPEGAGIKKRNVQKK